MRVVSFVVAAALMLGGCGGEDSARDEGATPSSVREPAALEAARSAAAPAVRSEAKRDAFLVELVYEVDFAPVERRPLPSGSPNDGSHGYVLRTVGPNLPPTLYPARGRSLDPDRTSELWVARRSDGHPLAPLGDSPSLESAASGTHRSAFGDEKGLLPSLAVEITLDRDGHVTATGSDPPASIAPGGTFIVGRAETSHTPEALADALLATHREAGTSALPSRDWVIARLSGLADDDGRVHAYARLVVHHRGGFILGRFDVEHEREEARRALREGPYELAEEALENVLEALPEDAEALALYRRGGGLLDAGAVPGRVRGTLRFPDGGPTDDQRELWKGFHGGFAWLERPGDSATSHFKLASVENGTFTLFAPAGDYRLRVAVPGFAVVDESVAVGADSAVDVHLEAP